MKMSRDQKAILISIALLLPFAGYKFFHTPKPAEKPRQEEPIADTAIANFKIPPEYTILYNDSAKLYAATWTFKEIPDDPFFLCFDKGDTNYVSCRWWNVHEITTPKREDIIRVIKKHWGQILKDRQDHNNPSLPAQNSDAVQKKYKKF